MGPSYFTKSIYCHDEAILTNSAEKGLDSRICYFRIILEHSQRKPPPLPIPSSHQTIPPSDKDCSSYYYTPSTRSFAGFEPLSTVQSDLLNHNNTFLATDSSLNHTTPDSFVSYYPVKEKFLMFGSEPSCSSSDGSSHGKEIKQEDVSNFQGFCAPNGYEDNHKFMLSYGNRNQWAEKPSGYHGETPLDYDLEDVKRLIDSSSSNNSCVKSERFDGVRPKGGG
ncbi:hypothetical protein GOBAR_DD13660 [Gossypium barbadense]|nr:hypothetical protein GOBAR_DD13660 [Gossypium barbadense]